MNTHHKSHSRALPIVIAVVAASAALVAGPPAQAAALCVNPGGTGGCFSTIEAAVSAALDGDVISVAAGTYTEPDGQLLIDKAVTIQGAGATLTTFDGQSSTTLPSAGSVRITAAGDVTVRDLGVTGAGGTSPSTKIAIMTKGSPNGQDYLFEDVDVQGSGSSSGNDYGLDSDHSGANLTIRSSAIHGTDFNPVLVERPLGSVDIDDNTIAPLASVSGSAIFLMSYSGDSVTAPVRVRNNSVSLSGISVVGDFTNGAGAGGFSDVQVTGNDVTALGGGSAVGLTNNDADPGGANGTISNVLVSGNVLAGTGVANTRGVTVTGVVTGTQVQANSISGFDHGLRVVDNGGGAPTGTVVRFNRIVDNTVGLQVNGTASVNAENDWWGCNAGPANAACDAVVVGSGSVDTNPYLKLGVTAGSSALGTGASTTLTASVRTNSDSVEQAGPFWRGSSIGFTTNRGSVSPASVALAPATGTASTTLSAGAVGGSGAASAMLDGTATQVAFSVTAPTVPDTTPPVVSNLRLDPRRFIAGSAPTPTVGRARGTTIRFGLSEAATVTLRVVRVPPKKPGKPTFWNVRSFKRAAAIGENAVAFTGTLRSHTFQPGKYRLIVQAVDAAGNVSTQVDARFRIIAAR
jgi:hypothetical protein